MRQLHSPVDNFAKVEKRRGKKKGAQQAAPLRTLAEMNSALLFFLDCQLHAGGDFAMKLHGNFILADNFDGLGERDLALVDRKSLSGERVGNIGVGNGSEKLIAVSSLARHL